MVPYSIKSVMCFLKHCHGSIHKRSAWWFYLMGCWAKRIFKHGVFLLLTTEVTFLQIIIGSIIKAIDKHRSRATIRGIFEKYQQISDCLNTNLISSFLLGTNIPQALSMIALQYLAFTARYTLLTSFLINVKFEIFKSNNCPMILF